MREARRAGLPADNLTPLGSLRRCAADVGDVSLLAVAAPAAHGEVLDGFLALPFVTAVLARLPSCVEAATDRGRVRLHVERARGRRGGARLAHRRAPSYRTAAGMGHENRARAA